jgi:dTDP-glucose 4,6-dehydratase
LKTAVVTGGAGFLGSHLCDRLLAEGYRVTVVDNLITGSVDNIAHNEQNPNFTFCRADATRYIDVDGPVDVIFHFASPASPVDYMKYPIQTLKVGSLGTHKALGVARAKDAKFVLASTSEVYGDPQVHPQTEEYWGNVNPVGPRGVYDCSKRFGEAITMAYHRYHKMNTSIARIFNTYGPRMRMNDGRAVPTFFYAAMKGDPITIHGDGTQTRSFCYVSDLIEAVWRLSQSDYHMPVNIGNPHEITILELARMIAEAVGSESEIAFGELPQDDPKVRCPDISKARTILGWEPKVSLKEGLSETLSHFKKRIEAA